MRSPHVTPLLALLVALLIGLVIALAALVAWQNGDEVAAPDVTTANAVEHHGSTARHDGSRTEASGAPADAQSANDLTSERDIVATNAPPTVHGRISRGGLPIRGREVVLRRASDGGEWTTVTDNDGGYRFEASRGEHSVEVGVGRGTVNHQRVFSRWPPDPASRLRAARRTLDVTAGDMRCDIALPIGALAVRVLDGETWQPIANATVAWRPPPPIMQELQLDTDATGTVRFDEVAPGGHAVAASARAYRPAEAELPLAAGAITATLDLRLEPTGALDVVLVDAAGKALEISAAQEVRVLSVLTTAVFEPSNKAALRQKPRPRAFEFDDLMPGSYWVSLGDDDVKKGEQRVIRFSPVTSETMGEIDVEPGKIARVPVEVRYRCYAELTGFDADGTKTGATLRVLWLDPVAGTAEVRPAPWFHGRGDHSFEGYLAPGTYTLEWTRKDRDWRATITVGSEPIDRSFMLPW